MATRGDVERALAEVLDPEYPVSVVDLGLIRGVEVENTTAKVDIAYCSLGCPCIDMIEQDVRQRLLQLEGIDRVELAESFDRWTRGDVSSKGLAQLLRAGVG
jgi:metal-sulfur cluster biosynthetic enzyme